jgi:hypothetical protein
MGQRLYISLSLTKLFPCFSSSDPTDPLLALSRGWEEEGKGSFRYPHKKIICKDLRLSFIKYSRKNSGLFRVLLQPY